MVGKGWVVIYGLLLLIVIFMFFSQLATNGEVDKLKVEVARLKEQPVTPQASDTPVPSPIASTSPDLSTASARDAQRKADMLATQKGLAEYFKERKTYPNERKDLVPKYLETLPADPLAPKYNYRYKKSGSGYELSCFLEIKGDPDDAADGKKDQAYTVTDKKPIP